MPGWYVHLEAGHLAAERMRTGDIPADFPLSAAQASDLGEIAHRWRNYLSAGALGPDLFFLLPDYKGNAGSFLLTVIDWALDTWETLDDEFVSKWEKWMGPVTTDLALIEANLSGGVLNEIGQGLNDLSASVTNAFETLITRFGDLFGFLSCGVPQGFENTTFFWSDMFHYRRTYEFPWQLFKEASTARAAAQAAGDDGALNDAEARMAFAMGWMCHCGTDVVGHSFTNSKVGGPYRTHWQRHHIVENHMDSQNYDARHGGDPLYGTYGTSALHFRLAFVDAGTPPPDPMYTGRDDQPAYDYFTGFPAYDLSESALGDQNRHQFFDLDTNDLPDHLKTALIETIGAVYAGDHPLILTHEPAFTTDDGHGPTGIPNETALSEMWQLVYRYLKMVSSDGFSPSLPPPPPFINDHPFPTPPGSSSVGDDPARGADPTDSSFNLLDLLLAVLAWAEYLAEVAAWIATVLPGLIVDAATFPLRETLYWTFVVPAWNIYLLSRRMLVMEGFLMPRPEEVDRGLVTLGVAPGNPWPNLMADLADPTGYYMGPPLGAAFDEPSGRSAPGSEWGADPAYPRAPVIGDPSLIDSLHLNPGPSLPCIPETASEWVAPWNYPLHDLAGHTVGWEAPLTHPGPWVQGDQTSLLLTHLPGSPAARADYESARTPAETEANSAVHLPANETLGGPVDYSLHIIGMLAQAVNATECPLPDMNLDSDRGYAAQCWDWDRHDPSDGPQFVATPAVVSDPTENQRYVFQQPCTVPQGYDCHWSPSGMRYDPLQALATHYLGTNAPPPDGCHGRNPIDPRDRDRAQTPPQGSDR